MNSKPIRPAYGAGSASAPPSPIAGDRLQRQLFSQSQHDRLLAGTLEAVVERGYPAASVAHITGAAGVSRATFYELFANKDDCVLATYDRIEEWLRAGVRPALSQGEDWSGGVAVGVQTALELLASDPRLAIFCGQEALVNRGPALERHEAVLEDLSAALRGGREQCHWGAQLPRRLEQTAIGGVIWLVAHRARRGSAEALLALGPELTYFLLTPYLGVSEALRLAAVEPLRMTDPGQCG
jgi:AcrR family transcriptional regulator